MTSSEIRASFLDFFREKGHTIVPSAALLPDSPNLLFTNAGMNQFVPIFLGQTPAPQPPRIADTQKCIRAGGKHNDLEDVGFDTYHHTFFEMLGNWSFGDYFKKEAIAWAWELFVERWKIPPQRIYVTVYQPNEGDPGAFDQEASDHWTRIFTAAGLDPQKHIIRSNENFWMMGDTGPCGPCSELHIDCTPEGDGSRVNAGDPRVMEIWNLVFIQFNANPDGTYVELPAKHVDTGMGFERIVSILQGTKGFTDFATPISNYDTDVFQPLFAELEKLTGKTYTKAMPASRENLSEQEKVDVAFRVIADHIRTLSFSIADGIQPSNEGRGYVLRRILRRAVRYGRNLGLREPFLGKLVAVLGTTMGPIFPEVVTKADLIKKTLRQEEDSFRRTLETGLAIFDHAARMGERIEQRAREAAKIFESFMQAGPAWSPNYADYGISTEQAEMAKTVDEIAKTKLPGKVFELLESTKGQFSGLSAFLLYDTYGFPLDLTELMARERGLTVDVAEFNRLMEEQKERGRAAQNVNVIKLARNSDYEGTTKFIYDAYVVETVVRGISAERVYSQTSEVSSFVPEATPLYPAMGGQVGDTGFAEITLDDGKVLSVEIEGVERIGSGAIFHDLIKPVIGVDGLEPIRISVDQPRRHKIEAHHSGTHLLNWALRKVLGNTITQKGSYVGPDRLRFDFSHGGALTHEELTEVERLVNEKIEADVPVKWEERAYTEVKGDPSILQFFGDKYGDQVRVVSIGDFSKELCGGTHVRQSAKIGYFKILHEAAIAAGIRRIEAASGEGLRAHLEEILHKQDEQVAAARRAAVPSSVAAEPTAAQRAAATTAAATDAATESLPDLWQNYKDREKLLHDLAAQRAQHEKEAAKQQEALFQKRAAETAPDLIGAATDLNGVPFLAVEIDGAPAAYLPVLADALKTRWQGVAVLATIDQGKVALLAAVAPVHTKKIQAGKIIQAIAPLVGGKGGGRPELAQGGGTNPAGVASALAKAEEMVRGI